MRRFRRSRSDEAIPAASDTRTDTLVEENWPAVVEEEEPVGPPPSPPRPRPPLLWPWLLLLLLLVAAGLIALWFFTRDNDHKASTVVVPNVIGEKQGAAVRRLDGARLASRVVAKPNPAPSGTVFAEEPGPGTHVPRGSVVNLSVSSSNVAKVPNVVGEKAAVATRDLRARGLTVQKTAVRSSEPPGVVVAQSPTAGTAVAKNSTIVIRVSQGTVRVPNVVGQTRSEAIGALRGAGLVPRAFTVPSSQPRGTVVAQRPGAGARVSQGSKVRINLSNGSGSGGAPPPPPPPPPPPAPAGQTVPDVTDEVQSAAQRDLNVDGFKARVVFVASDQPAGLVVSQVPAANAEAKKGTRVRLEASLGPSAGAGSAVPRVIGLSRDAATARLQNAGFRVQRLFQTTSVRSQIGRVVDEQPAGDNVPAGSTVTIYIGRLSG
jgi:beta-lactam-binding protein with PASTA domain